ncbi:MAG: hypothetical protein ACRYGK_04415, partial [Janthinobacterium lividum]
MTPLAQEIRARTDCADAIAARDLDAIAAIVSAGRTELRSRFITARTILAECGADGPGILDALVAVSAQDSTVKWAVTFLSQNSGMDIGNAVTQYMIDQLQAGGAFNADQAAKLKALGIQPAPVTRDMVAEALFNDDGSEKA